MSGGKRGPKLRPWQTLFLKHVVVFEGHWLWMGSVDAAGTPRFTRYERETPGSPTRRTALWFAYEVKYGVRAPEGRTSVSRLPGCKERLCVNPEHFTDSTPEALRPMESRDAEIREMHKMHMKWKPWSMAAIGRKFGMSRERVRQIVKAGGV